MGYTPENNPYIPGDPYCYDLKWLVAEVKHAIALYTPLSQEFSDLSAEFTALHDYVMNYFDNLDITEEVRQILQEMADDGTLTQLMAEYFGCVTPQMFGAKGDGVTDDTAAVQQLNGQLAFIPEGIYCISNVEFGEGTRLNGSGMRKSIFKRLSGATGTMVFFNNSYGSVITNMGFEGNYIPDPYENVNITGTDSLLKIGTTGSYTYDSMNYCAFENIYIANSEEHGLIFTGYHNPTVDHTYNWVFRPNNIQIHGCRGYGMIDMSSDNCFSNFYISGGHMGCMFCDIASKNMYVNFKMDGAYELYGSEFASALLSINRGASLRFINLDVQSSKKYGIYIKEHTNSYFNGCINNVFIDDQSNPAAAYIKIASSRYNQFCMDLTKLGTEVPTSVIFTNSAANSCQFTGEYIGFTDDNYSNVVLNETARRFFVPLSKSFTMSNLLTNGDFSGTPGTAPTGWTFQAGSGVIGAAAPNGNYLTITSPNTILRQNVATTAGYFIFGFFCNDTLPAEAYMYLDNTDSQQLRDNHKRPSGFGSNRGNLYYYIGKITQNTAYPVCLFSTANNINIYGAFLYRIPDAYGEVLLGNKVTATTVIPSYNTQLTEALTDQIMADDTAFLSSATFTFTEENIGALVRHLIIKDS